jgi:hypothetical protein
LLAATVTALGFQDAALAAPLPAAFAFLLFLLPSFPSFSLAGPKTGQKGGETRTQRATKRGPSWEPIFKKTCQDIETIGVHRE